MSLYRQTGQRRRWILLALGIGVAAGLLVGFLTGRTSRDSHPSLARAIADLRDRARTVSDALELVTIEYPQAVQNGHVVAATEYAAAQRDVETARERAAQLQPDLAALAPVAARRATKQLDELAALVHQRAPVADVTRKANDARRAFARATGGTP